MPKFDYYVKWDEENEDEYTLFKRIVYALILKRIRYKKPAITHISAKSGEGKSETALYLMNTILEIQDINIIDYMDDINIFNQNEYPSKLKAILTSKLLKKINTLAIHEGREALEANQWHSVFNRNVAHVNAMARAIKRMATFIISQSIMDITKQVRYTLDYQIKLDRPMRSGERGQVRIFWYMIYTDDRDLESPKLSKRRVRGIIMTPQGKYVVHRPTYFSIPELPKEKLQKFRELDRKSKEKILLDKLEEMEHSVNQSKIHDKVALLVKFYKENEMARRDNIMLKGKKYRVVKGFAERHNLKPTEVKDFEKRMKESLESMEDEFKL